MILSRAPCQVGKEERHSDHRVTSVIYGRVDHSAIALASDQRIGLTHLGSNVDLSHGGCLIGASEFLGDIPEGTAAREVGTGDWCIRVCYLFQRDALGFGYLCSPFEEVRGNAHQGIFLTERLAVFADEGETVHIRIDGYSHVGMLLDHCC